MLSGCAPSKHPSTHIANDDHAKPAVMVEQFPDLAVRRLQCRRVVDDASAFQYRLGDTDERLGGDPQRVQHIPKQALSHIKFWFDRITDSKLVGGFLQVHAYEKHTVAPSEDISFAFPIAYFCFKS